MIRVTLIGTGEISKEMAITINQLPDDIILYGVVSRKAETGAEFAQKYKIEKVFTSLEDVVYDNQTDLAYIGTPHTAHFPQSKYFLENKISVLCEKPICVNAKELEELLIIAHENETLLVDATWPRYMPFVKTVKELPIKHNLGKLLNVHASLGIQKQDVDRMVNPNLAGGSLLDVGIYPITVACMFNDTQVTSIKALSKDTELGVDQSVVILLEFTDGMLATLQSSIGSIMSDISTLSYENGLIELHGIPKVEKAIVKDSGHEVLEEINFDYITGYEYEVYETVDAIENDQLKVKSMTHSESLRVLNIMDEVRRQIDLQYPFEKEV
ncbi:MAG TPA: Gfo/Idh/MocA family oxidoreductase [Erysipelothrix sp.]|nr:Gfo/Idh/MocA family oxidoreductase [Erysipelothrix sp.]